MISRAEIFSYVEENFGVTPDYPWARSPNSAILRHRCSRKWFAAILDITQDKLGLDGDTLIDVLNLKCDPLLIGSLTKEPGIFPAYHMNKEHWVSIQLSSSIAAKSVYSLIDLSYELSKP